MLFEEFKIENLGKGEFINVNKFHQLFSTVKKRINKSNYILEYKHINSLNFVCATPIYISNRKTLQSFVKKFNINKDLLIFAWDSENKKYSVYKLDWCI